MTKTALTLVVSTTLVIAGCGDWEPPAYGVSSIVFGIEQKKTADGKVVTNAGYEMLSLGGSGWRARALRDRDRSCWSEKLANRLGQPRVEGGRASFAGARLPAEGIVVLANQAKDTVFDGQAWATGEKLRFQANGFAMPEVGPYEVPGPSTDLEITVPDAAAPLALHAGVDMDVAWNPGGASTPDEAVVAALEIGTEDAPGTVVRCFFDRAKGSGKIPHELMADLPDTTDALRGTLYIATHQQLDAIAPGDWVVYVVATVEQRAQAFTLTR